MSETLYFPRDDEITGFGTLANAIDQSEKKMALKMALDKTPKKPAL